MISQKRLKQLVKYDPNTGAFTWLDDRNGAVKIGSPAGSYLPGGYHKICVENRRYYAQVLAWIYIYGVAPENEVDHKDRDKHNNEITNLRDVTHLDNMANQGVRKNNSSGVRGVTYHTNGWMARIMRDGFHHYFGVHNTVEEASAALEAGKVSLQLRSAQ